MEVVEHGVVAERALCGMGTIPAVVGASARPTRAGTRLPRFDTPKGKLMKLELGPGGD